MKKILIISTLLLSLIITPSIAQPYVSGEKTTKVFSEDFSDVSESFPMTSSNDPKFWGTYGDGYYYMKRKIERPRVILANFKGTSRDFYLKTKIQLGSVKSSESTVGILFLTQLGGRGGFLLEINKKKKFKITDIGNNTTITLNGDKGWIPCKAIDGIQRNNTIEVKAFRGKFDVYFNNIYTYSFINDSYKKGGFGAYIGSLAEAKIIYYNVYELELPNAPAEIIPENLIAEIVNLKAANDSLKTQLLTANYGDQKGTKAAIYAIKILEEQVGASRKENLHLKNLITEYEALEPSIDSKESEQKSTETVNKITKLTNERDSLRNRCETLNHDLSILEQEIKTAKSEMNQLKSQINKEVEDSKEPAETSLPLDAPSIVIEKFDEARKETDTKKKTNPTLLPLSELENPVEKSKKGKEEEEEEEEEVKKPAETSLPLDAPSFVVKKLDDTEKETDTRKKTTPILLPLSEQEIPIEKAKKGEFKD